MLKQSQVNPFRFHCAQCLKVCSPFHLVITVMASYFHERRHFCSIECAKAWLGPGS